MPGTVRRQLLECWDSLDTASQRSLLDYARYLVVRSERPPLALEVPQHEQRPQRETVVAAIQRLTRVYPMVDRRKVLGETTVLMSRHVLEGQPAREVIDELEQLFAAHYCASAGSD